MYNKITDNKIYDTDVITLYNIYLNNIMYLLLFPTHIDISMHVVRASIIATCLGDT